MDTEAWKAYCQQRYLEETSRDTVKADLFAEMVTQLQRNNKQRETVRFMPAQFINTYLKGFFQMMITDEVHEMGRDSGQHAAYTKQVQAVM